MPWSGTNSPTEFRMSMSEYQFHHKEQPTAGQVDLIMPRQQGHNKSLTCMVLPVCLRDWWQCPLLDWPPPSCHSTTLVSRSHFLHHTTAWSEGIQNCQKQLGHQILLEHSRNLRGEWFDCDSKETKGNQIIHFHLVHVNTLSSLIYYWIL